MRLIRFKIDTITQGSKTGARYWFGNVLCVSFGWKYPYSSVWLHTYFRVQFGDIVILDWTRKSKNSSADECLPDPYTRTYPCEGFILDPQKMMEEYDANKPASAFHFWENLESAATRTKTAFYMSGGDDSPTTGEP